MPPVVLMFNDSSLRSYTIMDSRDTPVEEDSRYTITITAFNSVGRNATSNIASTSTAQAGKPCMPLWVYACMHVKLQLSSVS